MNFQPETQTILTTERQGTGGRHVEVALFRRPDGRPVCWIDRQGILYYYRPERDGRYRRRRTKPNPTNHYVYFNVGHGSDSFHFYLHRAVLFAWVGPPPEGCECDHINGDRYDNRLCNLRWLSREENHKRRKPMVYHTYKIEIYHRATLSLILKTSSVKEASMAVKRETSSEGWLMGVLIHAPECTDRVLTSGDYQIVVTKTPRAATAPLLRGDENETRPSTAAT